MIGDKSESEWGQDEKFSIVSPEFTKRWIRRQIRAERDIYDIGFDRLRPTRSRYYAIERKELTDAGYRREFQKWITVEVDGRLKKFRLYKWVK